MQRLENIVFLCFSVSVPHGRPCVYFESGIYRICSISESRCLLYHLSGAGGDTNVHRFAEQSHWFLFIFFRIDYRPTHLILNSSRVVCSVLLILQRKQGSVQRVTHYLSTRRSKCFLRPDANSRIEGDLQPVMVPPGTGYSRRSTIAHPLVVCARNNRAGGVIEGFPPRPQGGIPDRPLSSSRPTMGLAGLEWSLLALADCGSSFWLGSAATVGGRDAWHGGADSGEKEIEVLNF